MSNKHSKETRGGVEAGLLGRPPREVGERGRRYSGVGGGGSRGSGNSCQSLRGPLKLARLCLLGLLIPALLVAVPLYMRYHVLHEQQYPVALSDVRLLDSRMSTLWCQRQVVKANASFNAYLMPNTPHYDSQPQRVGMTRHLMLQDDMKEYWAFYLLPGSKVHVSACSRYPGASLIVIRGYKHLRDCAYIGDDSSEEADEMVDGEVVGSTEKNDHSEGASPRPRLSAPDPVLGRSYDDSVKYERYTTTDTPSETTVRSHISSAEALDELWARVTSLGPSGRKALRRLAKRLEVEDGAVSSESEGEVSLLRRLVQELLKDGARLRQRKHHVKDPVVDVREEDWNGEPKRRTYRHLHTEMEGYSLGPGIERLRVLLEEEIRSGVNIFGAEEALQPPSRSRREASEELALQLNEGAGSQEDVAEEEDVEEMIPDGIADGRGIFNETTLNDKSNDEFWSSFSSSEEALLNCEGLILYLPLTARQSCNHPASATDTPTDTFSYVAPASGYYFFVFSSENEIQENLISVGFSLERTVYNVSTQLAQCDNATACTFPLDFLSSEKVVLEVPVAPGKEGPSPGDSSSTLEKHWNEEYLVVSSCEPRTALYLFCMILVPILILSFAFQ